MGLDCVCESGVSCFGNKEQAVRRSGARKTSNALVFNVWLRIADMCLEKTVTMLAFVGLILTYRGFSAWRLAR